MGRPYRQEITELPDTYLDALKTPIDGLVGFVSASLNSPLRAVGSGGSATACVFAAVLHEQVAGTVARHATPLEQIGMTPSHGTSVLLVSAGGNNKDITAAFEHACWLGRTTLGVLCSSGGSGKLAKLCASRTDIWLHDAAVRNADGFLATNSLLAACVWLSRAYGRHVPGQPLPERFVDLLPPRVYAGGYTAWLEDVLGGMSGVKTVVVLHDTLGRPAATDLESKLVEAGVCCVQPADYRNFAHGRHNWLDKHKDTGVILLTNAGCEGLAARTAELLPAGIPVVTLDTELDGPAGMLSLLVQCMCAAGVLGRQRGVDPGRPGVADFGRKLYAMGPRA